jgi:D-alanyl-lipoteichoic acid acyltransferase DltB (MBOAT superfamily)
MFSLMMLMFAAIGLWHGANYTFILWGVLNGLVFWVYLKLRKWGWVTPAEGRAKLSDIPSILLTNFFIGFLLVFFGSNSLGSAMDYIKHIIDPSFFTIPEYVVYYPVILGLLAWEWPFREGWHGLEVADWHPVIRWTLYFLMSFGVMYHFGEVKEFVYFQF